uniref:palmitoyl-protein hydrolase n=1 Tax=Mesocestoides corti TaxID=53468 RepID=A0A5K3EJM6_MESCO
MGNWLCGHYAKDSQVERITTEVVKPRAEHKASLIFLHGLGDSGRNWSLQLKRIVPPNCKVICPNARPIPVSVNQQCVMPAWFDIYGLTIDAPQDEAGIQKVAEQVSKIVRAEIDDEGIPPNRIILGGFSQGGSVALYTALTSPSLHGLGGVFILSSWLPLAQQLTSDASRIKADHNLPILQFHGTSDPVVPFAVGSLTNTVLNSFQFSNCELHQVPDLGHSCNEEELRLVRDFINKVLCT